MKRTLDRSGRSPLHYAACDGNSALVASLIKQGHDVSLSDKAGWTPLHFAAQASSVECARLLLDAGAQIDAEDSNGNTPLSTAVFESKGFGDLIIFFISRGSDPEKENHHGQSPIGLARLIANYDLLPYFRKNPNRAYNTRHSNPYQPPCFHAPA